MNQQEERIAWERERIPVLQRAIRKWRHEYHDLDALSIPDSVLDSLKHELKLLEDTNPDLITPDSPTQTVGGSA